MKTIKLFFMAILFFCGIANAQITKGNWMVGGVVALLLKNNILLLMIQVTKHTIMI